MDDLISYLFIAIVAFLAGLWIGRHPERMRQLEDRAIARIHERTAPHMSTPPNQPPKPPGAP